ncbi:MAG: GTPase [Fimbriiglobus sp.]
MAVNLPPHYHDAEARYKKAKSLEEKLAALREMWVILPKHKASEKVQMDLKSKISELNDQIEQEKSGPKKAAPGTFKIPRQGAGQVVFLGPPNAGKSTLLSKLTNATPAIAPYPFTTREPVPGMMAFENVKVQLIDLPPITSDHYEHFITDLTRSAKAAVLFLDLSEDDGPEATRATIARLQVARRLLVAQPSTDDDPTTYALPALLVATKCDDDAADIRLEMAKEALSDLNLTWFIVSAEKGTGLEDLRRAIYERLGVMRIYTKVPGKPVEKESPFTPAIGATVEEFAPMVHTDYEETLKAAKVWGSAAFDGQTVSRDHVLKEGDVVELL